MDISSKIAALYDKDTSLAYQNLKELEELSEIDNSLYPYMEKFLSMISDEKYVIRVRGYRLLCKQARWDCKNIIEANIALILHMLDDEKPTAIRQKLKVLEDVARYKPKLHNAIRDAVLEIDLSKLKDTMQPLVFKDIQSLLKVMGN